MRFFCKVGRRCRRHPLLCTEFSRCRGEPLCPLATRDSRLAAQRRTQTTNDERPTPCHPERSGNFASRSSREVEGPLPVPNLCPPRRGIPTIPPGAVLPARGPRLETRGLQPGDQRQTPSDQRPPPPTSPPQTPHSSPVAPENSSHIPQAPGKSDGAPREIRTRASHS